MKTGIVTAGPASARVAYSQMVPVSQRGQVRELAAIRVPAESRRQGHASALLRKVCGNADAGQITLILKVEPFDGKPVDTGRLAEFYERFSFVAIQAAPLVMARMPNRVLHG